MYAYAMAPHVLGLSFPLFLVLAITSSGDVRAVDDTQDSCSSTQSGKHEDNPTSSSEVRALLQTRTYRQSKTKQLPSMAENFDIDFHRDLANTVVHNERTTFYGRPAVFLERASGAQEHGPIILESPAADDVPYKLANPNRTFFSQWQQEEYLWPKVLAPITQYYLSIQGRGEGTQQPRPFFIESGARDGEEHSNTLFLEREKGWKGVLIEPSNREYPHLLAKRRKCYSWRGCLSPTGKSEDVRFLDTGDGLSHMSNESKYATVKAEPLLSILQAINRTSARLTVDFWSLDIEGSEGPVLQTTDFEAIEFGALMIEMNKGSKNSKQIRTVMSANHFIDIGGTKYDQPGALDHVFINPQYFEARGIPIPKHIEGLMPPTFR